MPLQTAIDTITQRVMKSKRIKNLASWPESEMPEILRRIKAYPADAQTHYAIMLIMMTGVRVSDLL